MSKRTWLAAGLLAAMSVSGAAFAQGGDKPAAAAPNQEERLKGVLGKYKSEQPGFPGITLTLKDGKLTMEAEGFPPLPVTLTEKDELKAALLPPDFKFTILRDKDGKATGLKVETPMGGGELKREPSKEEPKKEEPKEEAKKAEVPDILGRYEPEPAVDGVNPAEVILEKGKLTVKIEGQPSFTFTLDKNDKLIVEPALPDGTSIKLVRDKDGKVIGSEYTGPEGTVKFTRKTFPKPPGAEEKKETPDVLGKYEADSKDSPIQSGEILLEKDQLILRGEGQPDFPITIDKDGNILSDRFPEGVTAKLRKDKDGKVVGMDAETPLGKLGFTRKTFVKAPGAEEKKEEAKPEDKKLARIKAAAGTYKSDIPGVPVVTMKVENGKLIMEPEGMPAIEVTLGDDDVLKGEMLPPGFNLKLTRDKDGKVTGMVADTPMGTAEFKFTPEKKG
jgi:hypothetical protein